MADMPISIASKQSASLIASKSLAQPHAAVLQSLAACRRELPNQWQGLCPLTRVNAKTTVHLMRAQNPVVVEPHVAALDRRLVLREIKPPCAERH